MILVSLILLSAGLFAQATVRKEKSKPGIPAWVSDMGYWVVESNIHFPKTHEVSFYTHDNLLMYKERLEGVKLNPEKRSVKMKLKKTLESSVLSWYRQKTVQPGYNDNQAFVKTAFD